MEGFFDSLSSFFTIPELTGAIGAFLTYFIYFSRFMLPIAAIAVLSRCVRSMLREHYEPEVWGYLDLPDGSRVPLRHWECTVGSAKSCDVVVRDISVSKNHVVLIRDEFGNWGVHDIGLNDGSGVNGLVIGDEGAALEDGDSLNLGDCDLRFFNLTEEERGIIAERRTAPGREISPFNMFFYVSICQFLLALSQVYNAQPEYKSVIALSFTALFAAMWLYYIAMRAMGRLGLEVEAIAFFLSSLGLSVTASSVPENLLKQVFLLLAAIVLFVILGLWLRDLKRVKRTRNPAAIAAIALLLINLVFGQEYFGAKNWLSIGGFSFQPSEFVKIIYIYAGAATMDKLFRKRNLIVYIAFSAVCVGALALMGDFGTALVFFAAFLVISFMRSGSIGTVLLAVTGAGLAGFLALSVKPHIAQRFSAWGHVWEDIYDKGYQQVRAISAAASGGLFGLGAGKGWLHNIIAADTDLVFGVLSEELGLIVAVCAVAAIIVLALFTVRNASQSRSAFFVIAGCASVSMMMVQLGLNVFGSLDILPFTGVTFPFVSTGGSSLISCWALLAFIKATDTRKKASFTNRDPDKMPDYNEFSRLHEQAQQDAFGDDEQFSSDILPYGQNEQGDTEHPKRNLFDRRGEKRRPLK